MLFSGYEPRTAGNQRVHVPKITFENSTIGITALISDNLLFIGQVADFLNMLYKAFDKLIKKYQVNSSSHQLLQFFELSYLRIWESIYIVPSNINHFRPFSAGLQGRVDQWFIHSWLRDSELHRRETREPARHRDRKPRLWSHESFQRHERCSSSRPLPLFQMLKFT